MRFARDGLYAIGGDLTPDTVLEAYAKGLFPWDGRKPYPWFSPDPRMVILPGGFHASKNLRKLDRQRRLEVRYDTRFREVMEACATTPRPGQDSTWITDRMIEVYVALHKAGIAHSVEVYEDDALVGGLYGLVVGAVFFGESMFHHRRDASKMAMYDLTRRLDAAGVHLLDCQAETEHLRSIGAVRMPRATYLAKLREAWDQPCMWPRAMRHVVHDGS
jgi:leucyl/phenylalanyl-tRNA--protein transferase